MSVQIGVDTQVCEGKETRREVTKGKEFENKSTVQETEVVQGRSSMCGKSFSRRQKAIRLYVKCLSQGAGGQRAAL